MITAKGADRPMSIVHPLEATSNQPDRPVD
jgi:hypothetical protein